MRVVLSTLLMSLAFSQQALALNAKQIEEKLVQDLPSVQVDKVEKSEVAGFYFVDLKDGSSILISDDGRYIFSGELIDINQRINLTQERKAAANKMLLASISEEDLITFKAENESDVIYVFTDPSCPYCRLLHKEIPALNAMGITINYLLYPRGGDRGPGFESIQAVLHSDDKQAAIHEFKTNENSTKYDFSDKSDAEKEAVLADIRRFYDLGNRLGVRGTPATFLADGSAISGYKKAPELQEIINSRK
jgi:thiol:disulfide interchange protein DsbC